MAEQMECEVLVVGSGPAGLAAAVAASSKLSSVILVDENPSHGGQIWRQMGEVPNSSADRWLAEAFKSKVKLLSPASVYDLPHEDTASLSGPNGAIEVQFQKLVLATGARELFLPFPGWTLPGVFGVGGLQALVKQGFSIRGKRVAIAGSGPLLLAVAKHLAEHGANIMRIYEQAPQRGLRDFAWALRKHPNKILQVLSFMGTSRKLRPGWWIERAMGADRLETARATNGRDSEDFECDVLACAYGLVPNTELAQLAGCRLEGGFVWVDENQRSSNERVFCAGEITEIGGVEAAIVQGSIAGYAAVGSEIYARVYHRSRRKSQFFSESLRQAFPVRDEVLRLAEPETIVCRCEDVRFDELFGRSGFREAKLHTRLGMGPCQGRVCGAACKVLFNWEDPSVRPPIAPVPASHFAE